MRLRLWPREKKPEFCRGTSPKMELKRNFVDSKAAFRLHVGVDCESMMYVDQLIYLLEMVLEMMHACALRSKYVSR